VRGGRAHAETGFKMPEFLFVFGYESPVEWRTNRDEGTDFESTNAVWIAATDEEAALIAGRVYADHWVDELFRKQGIQGNPSWSDSSFAHWIEHKPLERFSGVALDLLDRFENVDASNEPAGD
jgi:hypothetical protein